MDQKKLIKVALFTPNTHGWGVPLLFEGPPGTAKSSIIESLSASFGLHCETIIASLREPADFLGLPVPNGKRTDYLPPSWAIRLDDKGGGVCFFDEMSTSAPATQAANLRVINERWAGDLRLNQRIRFLAAQNSVEESANGWDLSPPMANRFMHMKWETPSVSDWTQFQLGGSSKETKTFDALAEEKRVVESWDKPHAIAKGKITGFLRNRPDLLNAMPKKDSPQLSKAWPSSRSWDMAIRMLASCTIHGVDEADHCDVIAACVGNGAAGEFLTWSNANDLPDPEAILDGKIKFKHDAKRLDRTAATMSSCAAYLMNKTIPKHKDRLHTMWEIIDGLSDKAADLVIDAAQVMTQGRLTNDYPDVMKGPYMAAVSKLGPVLSAAGYTANK